MADIRVASERAKFGELFVKSIVQMWLPSRQICSNESDRGDRTRRVASFCE